MEVCIVFVVVVVVVLLSGIIYIVQRHFAEIFGSDAGAEVRRMRDTQKRWLLVGLVLLTGVLLGALIAKKHV